ncbi:MAG TPA: hypothetical protein VFV38_26295 [Ktedonobacteraceae bacterium]|nr:hypothetical protein [Ktedonobacteraceae bacterium]
MHERYAGHMQRLCAGVLQSSGETTPELRQAIQEYSARLSGGISSPTEYVPAELENYIHKIALSAYKITDQDIEVLRAGGYSEDALLEVTLSAALGASLFRLECGLCALKGNEGEAQRS